MTNLVETDTTSTGTLARDKKTDHIHSDGEFAEAALRRRSAIRIIRLPPTGSKAIGENKR